jgi:hypothetical protein
VVLRAGRVVADLRGEEISEARLARLAHLDAEQGADTCGQAARPAPVTNLETIA